MKFTTTPEELAEAVEGLRAAIRTQITDEQFTTLRADFEQSLMFCREAGLNDSQAAVVALWATTPSYFDLGPKEQILEALQPGRASMFRAAVLLEVLK